MNIAFLVLPCNFILTGCSSIRHCVTSFSEGRVFFCCYIFLTLKPYFITGIITRQKMSQPVRTCEQCSLTVKMVSVSERQEWKWGRTGQIILMDLLAGRPSVYDRQETRVLFHQCALLSSQLRRNHNYTLLQGLAPLRFVWGPLLCLPFLAMSSTDHRQEMEGDNGRLLNGPSCC